MKYLTLLALFALMGCGASLGGLNSLDGPHPHIVAAGEIRAGPISLLHSPVSNAKPVTDLTVISLTKGLNVGDMSLNAEIETRVLLFGFDL